MASTSEVQAEFDALAATLGISARQLGNLRSSMQLSHERIESARATLKETLSRESPPIDVVAFGSLARYEMTRESDFDYLVLSYGLDDKPGASRRSLEVANDLRTFFTLSSEADPEQAPVKAPGSSGMFGTIVPASELVDVIGLERDTNHSHSRRILLLEESVSLYRPETHKHLIRSIISRYLEARPIDSHGVPRFLLNDLARYWRTLAVDYQAKTPPPARYSIRYLKLLITRKFTYASSLAPLLSRPLGRTDSPLDEYLYEQFTLPPVLRFMAFAEAVVSSHSHLRPAFLNALDTVDAFNGLLANPDWRETIAAECSSSSDPRELPEFGNARSLADKLQDSLITIFFSAPIVDLARRYLVF